MPWGHGMHTLFKFPVRFSGWGASALVGTECWEQVLGPMILLLLGRVAVMGAHKEELL